jgi:putative aldouronate transport system permease protein
MEKELLLSKEHKKKYKIKDSKTDYIYYVICGIILAILVLVVIYPLYFIIIGSVSDPDAIFNGEVYLYPIGVTFDGYKKLLDEPLIWSGYRNTIIYTVLGTIFNIILTIPAGWALSRDYLPFRKLFMVLMIITMFFGGGLIPYYLICSHLGLVENPLILIIGGGVSVYNVFMCKSYFQSNIPKEVIEASEIDGCGEVRTFFDIVLPLSKSIISVMILFYAVGHWNNYVDALIFITDEKYYPLQLVLKNLLISAESQSNSGSSSETILEQLKIANQIKYSSIVVSSLPIIIIYPFIEKYFDQGILVGSFK